MILITGAAGKTGLAVVEQLTATGAAVRALVRAETSAAELVQRGARDVPVGDLGDQTALRRAVEGCRAIYHICPNVHPEEARIGRSMIEAARAAGVDHFVFHSVLHPQIRAMPHHWRKLEVEEALLESGLDFTILQPAAYFQNLLAQWPAVKSRGVFERPYAVESRVAMVDLDDVARVAARVLTESGHRGAIYELCGAELFDGREIAAAMGDALGKPVEAAVLERDAWAAAARRGGLTEDRIELLLAMFLHYERCGLMGNPRVLEGLLGRPPTTLGSFLRRAAAG